MRNRWLKRLFPFIAFLLLVPWPVAYAFDNPGNTEAQEGVRIEIAAESAKPAFTAFGRAIGSVESGELFYIDAADNPADMVTTLYLTNPQELVDYYSYFILQVGVYVQTDTGWEPATAGDGSPVSDAVLTMKNGRVSFVLPAYGNYMIGIDGGAFYCTSAAGDESELSPRFFLEVD